MTNILIFYIAGSASDTQAAYPPYGLASVSFTGLSCYLIYADLYASGSYYVAGHSGTSVN
jgi:hypothetical protein